MLRRRPAIKPDEAAFLRACFDAQEDRERNKKKVSIREIVTMVPIPHKRCWYLLEKWGKKGWYDYGVTLDLGWFTPEGIAAVEAMKAATLDRQRERE